MAGIITSLEVQKNNKERVNIYLDGIFVFGVTLTVALDLKKGQHLTDAEIARFKFNDTVDKAYQQALHYLGYRPRTRKEVREHLQKKGTSSEAIEITIERLTKQNYLDDVEFGRIWVENWARHNPKGRRALRYELYQKGLTEAEIEKTLNDLDEEALAWQAVRKRLPQWQKLDKWTLKRKLAGHLTRRGFDYDIIEAIFVKVWQDQETD